ncbi:MAG: hypothetical protein ABSD49_08480 [Candidatus Bathyarchaeia archaeon]
MPLKSLISISYPLVINEFSFENQINLLPPSRKSYQSFYQTEIRHTDLNGYANLP